MNDTSASASAKSNDYNEDEIINKINKELKMNIEKYKKKIIGRVKNKISSSN